jgi:integrase
MCGSAFRTSEIITLDVGDFSCINSAITLRSAQRKEALPINSATTYIIAAYIAASGHGGNPAAPLFCSLDHRPQFRGSRLTAKGVQHLVNSYGSDLGVRLSASMLRFTAIQTALAVTGGDIEKVRKFSRVADIRSIEACARAIPDAKNGMLESKLARQRAQATVARSDRELRRAQEAISRAIALPTVKDLREKNLRSATDFD